MQKHLIIFGASNRRWAIGLLDFTTKTIMSPALKLDHVGGSVTIVNRVYPITENDKTLLLKESPNFEIIAYPGARDQYEVQMNGVTLFGPGTFRVMELLLDQLKQDISRT